MKNESALKHGELTQKAIGVFFEVYNELGYGFLESVYQRAFEVALTAKGYAFAGRLKFLFGFAVRRWATLRQTFWWKVGYYWN